MKIIGYLWALPVTIMGLVVAAIARLTGGDVRAREGVIEVSGGMPGRILRGSRFFRGGAAATLGHVIFARNQECLERSRRHELFHVRQFERWGIFLLPMYWVISVWLRGQGFDPYLDHPWEPPLDSQ